MKTILVVLLIAFAAIGIASSQDLIKGVQKGGPVELSGLSGDIFDGAFFASDGWTFDTTSYSLTPSMAAFLADDADEGQGLGVASKKWAYVGSVVPGGN